MSKSRCSKARGTPAARISTPVICTKREQAVDHVVVVVGGGEPREVHPRPPDGEEDQHVAHDRAAGVVRRDRMVQERRRPATRPPRSRGRRAARAASTRGAPRRCLATSSVVARIRWSPRDGSGRIGTAGRYAAPVAVTGMANLAVKVADLDAACAFYERAGGESPRPHALERRRARRRVPRAGDDHAVHPGDLRGRGRAARRRASCTRRCSPTTSTPSSRATRWCGVPAIVEGPFGRRRIAFVAAPGGIRLEFMEQLEADPG